MPGKYKGYSCQEKGNLFTAVCLQEAGEEEDEVEEENSQSESEQPQGVKEVPPEEAIIPASEETSNDSEAMKEDKDVLTSTGPPEKNMSNLKIPEKVLPIQGQALEAGAVQKVAVNGTKRLFKRPEVDEAMADSA